MRTLVRKSNNLVLDRGAIPRTTAANMPSVHCGLRDVVTNNRVRRFVRMGDPALYLLRQSARRKIGKRYRKLVTWLRLEGFPSD